MHTIKLPYKAIISFITLIAFVINTIYMDAAWAFAPVETAVASPSLEISDFKLPTILGEVKEIYRGTKAKTIIHIQDAHCNYSAQSTVKNIISHLNANCGVNVVALEGGEGDYDLSVFTNIADGRIRAKVADYFAREGRINGAELFAVNNPDKVRLSGLEDADLYIKNLNVYRESLKYKSDADSILKKFADDITSLKAQIYSANLKELDAKKCAYTGQKLSLKEYIAYLHGLSKINAISLEPFPNLAQLIDAISQEGQINFERCAKERDCLIDEIQKKASPIELEDLVAWALNFKQGKVRADEFYLYLLEQGESLYIHAGKDYPNLVKYSQYLKKYESCDKYKVFEELEGFEEAIVTRIAQDDAQRDLYRRSKDLAILKRLFSISLTRDEYNYYTLNRRHFDTTVFSSSPDLKRLDSYRDHIEKFYECALKRDDAFLKNISKLLEKTDRVVLFSGGFHTENLKELFKKQGYSYVVIMPKFEYTENNQYFKLLSGGKSGIEELVSQNSSSIAIYDFLNHLGIKIEGSGAKADFDFGAGLMARLLALREGEELSVTLKGGPVAFKRLRAEVVVPGALECMLGDGTKIVRSVHGLASGYQNLEDIPIQEVKEGEDGYDSAVPIYCDPGTPAEQIEDAVRKEAAKKHWWLQDYWRTKGIPQEEIEIRVGDHPITIYNWNSARLTDEQLSQIVDALKQYAVIGGGLALKHVRYILIDNERKKNGKSGGELNGETGEGQNVIKLYPKALEPGDFRIAGVPNLVCVIIHELAHHLIWVDLGLAKHDAFIRKWERKFDWREPAGGFRVMPGGALSVNLVTDSPERCITDYASLDPFEDICESMVAALKCPEKLDPEKLKFLQDTFLIPLMERGGHADVPVKVTRRDRITLPRVESVIRFKKMMTRIFMPQMPKASEPPAIALAKAGNDWVQYTLTADQHEIINEAWSQLCWQDPAHPKYGLAPTDDVFREIADKLFSAAGELPVHIQSPPDKELYDKIYGLAQKKGIAFPPGFRLVTHPGTSRDEKGISRSYNLLIPQEELVRLRALRDKDPTAYREWFDHETGHLLDRVNRKRGAENDEERLGRFYPIGTFIEAYTKGESRKRPDSKDRDDELYREATETLESILDEKEAAAELKHKLLNSKTALYSLARLAKVLYETFRSEGVVSNREHIFYILSAIAATPDPYVSAERFIETKAASSFAKVARTLRGAFEREDVGGVTVGRVYRGIENIEKHISYILFQLAAMDDPRVAADKFLQTNSADAFAAFSRLLEDLFISERQNYIVTDEGADGKKIKMIKCSRSILFYLTASPDPKVSVELFSKVARNLEDAFKQRGVEGWRDYVYHILYFLSQDSDPVASTQRLLENGTIQQFVELASSLETLLRHRENGILYINSILCTFLLTRQPAPLVQRFLEQGAFRPVAEFVKLMEGSLGTDIAEAAHIATLISRVSLQPDVGACISSFVKLAKVLDGTFGQEALTGRKLYLLHILYLMSEKKHIAASADNFVAKGVAKPYAELAKKLEALSKDKNDEDIDDTTFLIYRLLETPDRQEAPEGYDEIRLALLYNALIKDMGEAFQREGLEGWREYVFRIISGLIMSPLQAEKLTEPKVISSLAALARLFRQMHSEGDAHRDVSTGNFLASVAELPDPQRSADLYIELARAITDVLPHEKVERLHDTLALIFLTLLSSAQQQEDLQKLTGLIRFLESEFKKEGIGDAGDLFQYLLEECGSHYGDTAAFIASLQERSTRIAASGSIAGYDDARQMGLDFISLRLSGLVIGWDEFQKEAKRYRPLKFLRRLAGAKPTFRQAPSFFASQITSTQSSPDMAKDEVTHPDRNRELAGVIANGNLFRVEADGRVSPVYHHDDVETNLTRENEAEAVKQSVVGKLQRIRSPTAPGQPSILEAVAASMKDEDISGLAGYLGISKNEVRKELVRIATEVPLLLVKGSLSLYHKGPIAHARRGVPNKIETTAIWVGEKLFTYQDITDEDIARLLLEEAEHILAPKAGHDVIIHNTNLRDKLLDLATKAGEEPDKNMCIADMAGEQKITLREQLGSIVQYFKRWVMIARWDKDIREKFFRHDLHGLKEVIFPDSERFTNRYNRRLHQVDQALVELVEREMLEQSAYPQLVSVLSEIIDRSNDLFKFHALKMLCVVLENDKLDAKEFSRTVYEPAIKVIEKKMRERPDIMPWWAVNPALKAVFKREGMALSVYEAAAAATTEMARISSRDLGVMTMIELCAVRNRLSFGAIDNSIKEAFKYWIPALAGVLSSSYSELSYNEARKYVGKTIAEIFEPGTEEYNELVSLMDAQGVQTAFVKRQTLALSRKMDKPISDAAAILIAFLASEAGNIRNGEAPEVFLADKITYWHNVENSHRAFPTVGCKIHLYAKDPSKGRAEDEDLFSGLLYEVPEMLGFEVRSPRLFKGMTGLNLELLIPPSNSHEVISALLYQMMKNGILDRSKYSIELQFTFAGNLTNETQYIAFTYLASRFYELAYPEKVISLMANDASIVISGGGILSDVQKGNNDVGSGQRTDYLGLLLPYRDTAEVNPIFRLDDREIIYGSARINRETDCLVARLLKDLQLLNYALSHYLKARSDPSRNERLAEAFASFKDKVKAQAQRFGIPKEAFQVTWRGEYDKYGMSDKNIWYRLYPYLNMLYQRKMDNPNLHPAFVELFNKTADEIEEIISDQPASSSQPPPDGPALFVDTSSGKTVVRELDQTEHYELNLVLAGILGNFSNPNEGVQKLTQDDTMRLCGQARIVPGSGRGPPMAISIYVIDDSKLPEKFQKSLITHAGTYRQTFSNGVKGPPRTYNLFIPRSIYEVLLKPEHAEDLTQWRNHEIGHLLHRDVDITPSPAEAAAALRIWETVNGAVNVDARVRMRSEVVGSMSKEFEDWNKRHQWWHQVLDRKLDEVPWEAKEVVAIAFAFLDMSEVTSPHLNALLDKMGLPPDAVLSIADPTFMDKIFEFLSKKYEPDLSNRKDEILNHAYGIGDTLVEDIQAGRIKIQSIASPASGAPLMCILRADDFAVQQVGKETGPANVTRKVAPLPSPAEHSRASVEADGGVKSIREANEQPTKKQETTAVFGKEEKKPVMNLEDALKKLRKPGQSRILPTQGDGKNRPGAGPGLIGAWVVTSDIEVSDRQTRTNPSGQLYLSFKARKISEPPEWEYPIKLSADPVSLEEGKNIYSNYEKRGLSPQIQEKLDTFLLGFQGSFYKINDKDGRGIYGMGRHDLLTIYKLMHPSPSIKLFHELCHAAIDSEARGILPEDTELYKMMVSHINGGEEAVEAYLKDKARIHKVAEKDLTRWKKEWRIHYMLRLFQKQTWPEEDKVLSKWIKQKNLEAKLTRCTSLDREINESLHENRHGLWVNGDERYIQRGYYVVLGRTGSAFKDSCGHMYGLKQLSDFETTWSDQSEIGWSFGLQQNVATNIGGSSVLVMDNHNYALPFIAEMMSQGRIRQGCRMAHIDMHDDRGENNLFKPDGYAALSSEKSKADYIADNSTIDDWQRPLFSMGVDEKKWQWFRLAGDPKQEMHWTDGVRGPVNPVEDLKDGVDILDIDIDFLEPLDRELSKDSQAVADVLKGIIPEKIMAKIRDLAKIAAKAKVITIATSPSYINQPRALVYTKELLRQIEMEKTVAAGLAKSRADDVEHNRYGEKGNITRGFDELDTMHGGRISKAIQQMIAAGKKPKTLLIGPGAGNVLLDMLVRFGDNIDLCSINLEPWLLNIAYLKKEGERMGIVPDKLSSYLYKIIKGHEAADVTNNFGKLDNERFDLIITAQTTMQYIPNKIALLSEMKKRLVKEGELFTDLDFFRMYRTAGGEVVDTMLFFMSELPGDEYNVYGMMHNGNEIPYEHYPLLHVTNKDPSNIYIPLEPLGGSSIEYVISQPVAQSSASDLGAQVANIKYLNRLLRIFNLLRKKKAIPELPENATDLQFMEHFIKYLSEKGLVTEGRDRDENYVVMIKNEALHHSDEELSSLVHLIHHRVVNPTKPTTGLKLGGAKAVNFYGAKGWTIVGFESEMNDPDTLAHERAEIGYRKKGLPWLYAHILAEKVEDEPLDKKLEALQQDLYDILAFKYPRLELEDSSSLKVLSSRLARMWDEKNLKFLVSLSDDDRGKTMKFQHAAYWLEKFDKENGVSKVIETDKEKRAKEFAKQLGSAEVGTPAQSSQGLVGKRQPAAEPQPSQPSDDIGAQVANVKYLNRLLRIFNILRKAENITEIPETATDKEIMEFLINYLTGKGLVDSELDSDGNCVVRIKDEALNHPDEKMRRLVRLIHHKVVNPSRLNVQLGGAKAVNFKGKIDRVIPGKGNKSGKKASHAGWIIVGFESELKDPGILKHERVEIKYRKDGLPWLYAHIVAENMIRDVAEWQRSKIDPQPGRGFVQLLPCSHGILDLVTSETLPRLTKLCSEASDHGRRIIVFYESADVVSQPEDHFEPLRSLAMSLGAPGLKQLLTDTAYRQDLENYFINKVLNPLTSRSEKYRQAIKEGYKFENPLDHYLARHRIDVSFEKPVFEGWRQIMLSIIETYDADDLQQRGDIKGYIAAAKRIVAYSVASSQARDEAILQQIETLATPDVMVVVVRGKLHPLISREGSRFDLSAPQFSRITGASPFPQVMYARLLGRPLTDEDAIFMQEPVFHCLYKVLNRSSSYSHPIAIVSSELAQRWERGDLEVFFSLRTDEERRAFVSDWLSKFENQYASSKQNVFGAAEGYKPTAEAQAAQSVADSKKTETETFTGRLLETVKPVLRQDKSTIIHTIVIVGDDVYREKAVADAGTQKLLAELKRAFGLKHYNDIHICRSYKEAAAILGKIKMDGASWANTFVYVDPRVEDDGSAKDFGAYIRTELVTPPDGSVLMAAPILGYAAYSQLYARLIETVLNMSANGKSKKDIKGSERIRDLAERMSKVVKDMTKTDADSAEIIDLVPDLIEVAASNKSIEAFLKNHQRQHHWALPPVKAFNWDQVHRWFELQRKAAETAA